MPILRKPKHENFTMVRNYFINDTRLKPNGKGVLLFMLSKKLYKTIRRPKIPQKKQV